MGFCEQAVQTEAASSHKHNPCSVVLTAVHLCWGHCQGPAGTHSSIVFGLITKGKSTGLGFNLPLTHFTTHFLILKEETMNKSDSIFTSPSSLMLIPLSSCPTPQGSCSCLDQIHHPFNLPTQPSTLTHSKLNPPGCPSLTITRFSFSSLHNQLLVFGLPGHSSVS